jgi:hypothetical protein
MEIKTMTKERACANGEAMLAEIHPVSKWENESVNGMALSSDSIFDDDIKKIRQLRKRQAEYLNTLPTDPDAAIRIALDHLSHDYGQYPEGVEDALHLSAILMDALQYSKVSDLDFDPEAAIHVASQINKAIRKAVAALDRASDVLLNPAKSQCELKSS